MSKKFFFFFISYLFSCSMQATSSSGIVSVALFGDCKTYPDIALYLSTPLVGMLVNSVTHCKKECARQQKEFEEASTKQKEALEEKKILCARLKKEMPENEWSILKKPEKYSLKTQALFFAKQVLKILTDPQAALAEQPFFTAMLLCAMYRVASIDELMSVVEKEKKTDTISKKLANDKNRVFGPDQQKIEHDQARKEYLELPDWVTSKSSEGLTDEQIRTLITNDLMPKVVENDKFSSVWERIAAAFAGCLGNQSQKVPYLCLDGKPGVGKTLFAKELAAALDYHCEVIECGILDGKSDNAKGDLKGFERTWSNSSVGRIVKVLQNAASKKKKGMVIVLDEIDKVANPDVLLALIDPEQNSRFTDKYLEVPIDLSQVIFIATSNDWVNRIEGRSAALASRLQCIEINSYTVAEKKAFAKKQIQDNPKYAQLKAFDQAEALIDELIEDRDKVDGGVRKVVQLLDAAQSYYQLSKIMSKEAKKDEIKAQVKATIKAS